MAKKSKSSLTYKAAGVDIDAGERLVEAIKPLAAATTRPGAMGEIGGFGGAFDLKAAGFKDPVLVASTDGVGSKVKIAVATGKYDTVGIDLVAMCVNDIVAAGAEPLFFLDYFATAKLDVKAAKAVISGIAEGCKQAGCALIGGETAEMPGLYKSKDFDLAGFAVGAAERDTLLDPRAVRPGDAIIGLSSSGLHSNGFSLVRKLVEESGLSYSDKNVFKGQDGTLGEQLLTPTRIYAVALKPLIKAKLVGALAHITGGGLLENIPRALASGTKAMIDASKWQAQPVLHWIREGADLPPLELLRTFNCGIGMALMAPESAADNVLSHFRKTGVEARVIGRVGKADGEEPVCEVTGAKGALGYTKPWRAATGEAR